MTIKILKSSIRLIPTFLMSFINKGYVITAHTSAADRDPTFTYKALQEFKRLKQRYPDYGKMEKVNDYMLKCQQALANHEFYIGEYYFKTKRYQAALDRFAAIQEEYPDCRKNAPGLRNMPTFAKLFWQTRWKPTPLPS